MYEISNGSRRYSYFSLVNPSETENRDCHLSDLSSRLTEIEWKQNNLDNLYTDCVSQYERASGSSMQQVILDRISSINEEKKRLDETRRRLVDEIDWARSRSITIDNNHRDNRDYSSQNDKNNGGIARICSSKSAAFSHNCSPIDFWSLEVFNHTLSRTLNKHKYLSPGFLLRETRDSYGHYNYTYFNDQMPEEVEVFDYNAPPIPKVIENIIPPKIAAPVQQNIVCKPLPVEQSRTVCINDIINRSIDSRHVIILRGLPGSGKSTFCQAFKEKEIMNGRSAPRILSVDHFFVEDGKFEYDPDLEPTYRHELFKLFKRQIDEGFFSVILVDCINEKVEQFSQFYQYANMNRFQASVLELKVSPTICAKRSENRFTPAQVYKMADDWEETPSRFDKLDADSFLQDSMIEDVEMEDITDEKQNDDSESESEENLVSETGFFKSKWDEDFEDTKERLDGMKQMSHEPQTTTLSIREYLRIEMENLNKPSMGDKSKGKQVKWADFEELKKQKKRKELGFVAGNTDWNKLMSSDIDVAEAALVQIRYFTKDTD